MKKSSMTKPTGRKPMRRGALLLKEVPYQSEWRVQATWRDPDRKKKWFNNWRHAEEFADKENKKLELLKEKGAGRYTFNDAADSCIKQLERRANAKDKAGLITFDSLYAIQGIIENHLRPKFGPMKLAEISTRIVSDWVLDQHQIAKTRTVRCRIAELNRVLDHAVEHDMLLVNPLQQKKIDRKLLGKVEKRAKIPARSDLETLREYLNGPRPLKHGRIKWSCTRMVVVLALSCGLRGGEAAALEWDDINPDTREIDINKARARLDGLKGPKTEAGYRKIPTTPAVQEIINQHAEIIKQLYGRCVGPVLRSRDRNYLSAAQVSHYFTNAMRACGLADPDTNKIKFTHHASRHWAASHWLKSTSDIHLSKTWLGHKNASMTMDIYGHCLDDPEARAKFERMPDWLAPVVQIESPSTAPEVPLALPAPEDTFEFGPKANGPVEPDCPIDVPDIAEPWVKPYLKLLQQGMSAADAYYEITPLMMNLRSTKNPTPLKWQTVCERVCEEFRRLKLPGPKTIVARFRAEKILKLHGQKYQSYEIARMVGCDYSLVKKVLRSRHKLNANNPLNHKVYLAENLGRKSQPGHKTQLKLL